MNRNKWKYWKIAALFVVPLAVTTPSAVHAADEIAPIAENVTAPISISGTVRQYYTNRAGFVTALDMDTTNGIQQVRFAPSWANRLLDQYAVGKTLDGWVVPHHQKGETWSDLVSLGKDAPQRYLTDEFYSGAQRLDDNSWIWKGGTNTRISGKLDKIVVNNQGDILALVLDNGALVRVPRTERNQELGAVGTDAIAPIFKDADVTAWGQREWQASGDISIYNQHLATDGISIEGKPVSAIGFQRLPIKSTSLTGGTANLGGINGVEVIGANGEYTPFGPGEGATPLPYPNVYNPHQGRAMLQTADGKYYLAQHDGRQIFAKINGETHLLPLINGTYRMPFGLADSKLVMAMDDGRHFDMESANGQLYVVLPDGNKSPVQL